MVGQIVARGQLRNFLIFLRLDEKVKVLQLLISSVVPKMDLVSSHSCKFQETAFKHPISQGDIIAFVKSVTRCLQFSKGEVPDADSALSEIPNRNQKLAIIRQLDGLNPSGMELHLPLNGEITANDIDVRSIVFLTLSDG